MSTLGDPSICPDCRAPLGPDLVCTRCGLVLHGAAASALWEHLQQADLLVGELRRAAAPVAAAAVPAAPVTAGGSLTAGLPSAPPLPVPVLPVPSRRLSVPVVLLGLGGICVLVAAIVFVAVTWSSLGLAGRTVILIGVTAIAVTAAVALTRRGLRGGAETLWLVAHVLLAIDVVAAAVADLGGLGDLDSRHLAGGLGALLLVSAVGVSAWATTTPVPRIYGLVATSVAGMLLLTVSEAWAAERSALATAVSLPVAAGLALLVGGLAGGKLRPHGYGIAAVGTISWAVLVGHGLSRAGALTTTTWWQELQGWPFLVAAAAAAAAAYARPLAEPVRSLAAGAALACLALFALGGTSEADTKVLVGSGVAVAVAAVAGLGPRPWAAPAAVMAAAAALVAVPVALVRPLGVAGLSGTDRTGLDRHFPPTSWDLASWTAPVVVVAGVACLLALVRHLPDGLRPAGHATWRGAAPVLLGLGLVTWFLESEPRLPAGVAAWVALAAAAAVLTRVSSRTDAALLTGLALDAYLVAMALYFSTPSHLVLALVATAIAAVSAAAAGAGGPERLAGSLVAGLSGTAAAAALLGATQWAAVIAPDEVRTRAVPLTLALVASALGLAAALLGRTPSSRITLESTALIAGLVSVRLSDDPVVAAAILTVLGSTVALVSIVYRDRDLLSWVASGLLALAVVVRVEDGVPAPEVVVLPAAALLVAVGVRRLLTDPDVTSYRALGSGLVLGLTPSLIGTLEDPVSLRGALVAAAGLAFLALGVSRRWAAPFGAGALVVAVVAVRHLGPVAEALPRWISLGSVGVLLLLVGVTWEARRRDARTAERYLTALR